MTRLADLDPKFLAFLRARSYVNGLGPRSWVIDGKRIVVPAWMHLPTPGLKSAWEFHDYGCLAGGDDGARLELQDQVIDIMHAEADAAWWLRSAAVDRIAIPAARWVFDHFGKKRFRYTTSGLPRSERALMLELGYVTT